MNKLKQFFLYKNFKKALLAGVLIGLGVIINLQLNIAIIGAMLFSFGLLTIVNLKLPLYTGKIGYITSQNDLKQLTQILIFNFIGIAAVVGLYALANWDFYNIIAVAAAAKFSKNIITLFINACFCGSLIHLAVINKKTIIIIFSIIIFILIGAEHCVADCAYFLFNLSLINGFKLFSIVIGNSLGAILIERLNKN